MRRWRILSCLLVLTAALARPAAAQTHWVATLVGANESPAVSSAAIGQFDATVSAGQDNMTFTLTYSGLVGNMTQANIQRGVSGTNGPILYWLANGNVASPVIACSDPTPAGGGCGFNASDFADLQAGNLYVNLSSSFAPNGEIRGQITSATPVGPGTWARMKAMYR
jgi:CHRD domain-containing protein